MSLHTANVYLKFITISFLYIHSNYKIKFVYLSLPNKVPPTHFYYLIV